ncbi:MAG: hypothetical protein ACK4ZM_03075 [bacterium]
MELLIFIFFLAALIFIDGFTRILYLILRYKPDYFMYSFFRFSLIVLIILLFIKIFPDFYFYAIGFLVYLLFGGIIWKNILKVWSMNYERRRNKEG